MQVFDATSTCALLPARALIDAIADAMRARRAGTLHAPERLVLPLPGDGCFLAMPAADDVLAVAKIVSVHPGNTARGLPTIHGHVLVTDARNGRPLMLLDGPTVTARRTAAVSALGLQLLARRPVEAIALLGTGAQAQEHARFLVEAGLVRRLYLVGREMAKTQALAARLADAMLPGTSVASHTDVNEALPCVQAVITLTTSDRPVLPPDVPGDVLVIATGAFTPRMAELPPALLHARRIVVDALAGARAEAGDLLQAKVDWSRVTELVDHLQAGAEAGPFVLKTVGQAAWDLAAAHVANRMLGVHRT